MYEWEKVEPTSSRRISRIISKWPEPERIRGWIHSLERAAAENKEAEVRRLLGEVAGLGQAPRKAGSAPAEVKAKGQAVQTEELGAQTAAS